MANDLPPLPKTFVGSAILQLLAGAVALNAGIISLIWGCMLGYIATGIWVGSVAVITSIIGVLTAVYRTRAWLISYLSLSALCSLLAVVLSSIEMSAFYEERETCATFYSYGPCDGQCKMVHEFNVGAGCVELFAAVGAMALCVQGLWTIMMTHTPYKKMVNQLPVNI